MRKMISTLFIMCFLFIVFPMNEVQAESREPRLMITGFEITNDYVIPGEDFVLSLTVKNMNTKNVTESILISGSTKNGEIVPSYGMSNQAYISRLEPEEETTIEFNFHVQEQVEQYNVIMEFSFDFVGEFYDNGGDLYHYGSVATVAIPIGGIGTLNVNDLSVVEQGIVGTPIRINSHLENSGKLLLEDIVLHISGDVKDGEKNIAVGSIEAGGKKFDEVYVDSAMEGKNNISIYYTYKDEDGNVYQTKNYDYEINMIERGETVTENHLENGETEVEKGISIAIWQVCLIIAVIILIVGSIVFYRSRKRK